MARRRWVAIVAGALAVAVLLLVVVFVFRGETDMTPEDLARQWVAGNVDTVGEDIAGWMAAGNPVLRELGGEYIEDRIHDVINWEYSAAERRSDGVYDLTATARVRFDIPGGAGEIDAGVPWEMVIDMDAESVSARPQWIRAYLKAPGIPAGLDSVTQLAAAVPSVEEKARDLLGKVDQQTAAGVTAGGQSGVVPTPVPGTSDLPGTVSAAPAANGTPAGLLPATPVSSFGGASYASCLDDFYLRVADDYGVEYWLPAAVWYCRDLAPVPQGGYSSDRCILDRMEDVEVQYSGSGERWGWWYAIAVCKPLPSADESHIASSSGVQPTVYGTCLDNAYLSNRELISEFVGDGEVLVGVSAWLCRGYLPEPPATHLRRCDLDRTAGTRELYPEWPERLHDWHAIMQCLPEWRPNEVPGESAYTTCLSDVYLQVADSYDRKDRAIPVAVWRCRDQMPAPPAFYNPRCEINHRRRDEESGLQWPDELHGWNSIVQCYPAYGGSP